MNDIGSRELTRLLAEHERQIAAFERSIAKAEIAMLHPHTANSVADLTAQIAAWQSAIESHRVKALDLQRSLGLSVEAQPLPIPAKVRRKGEK